MFCSDSELCKYVACAWIIVLLFSLKQFDGLNGCRPGSELFQAYLSYSQV